MKNQKKRKKAKSEDWLLRFKVTFFYRVPFGGISADQINYLIFFVKANSIALSCGHMKIKKALNSFYHKNIFDRK